MGDVLATVREAPSKSARSRSEHVVEKPDVQDQARASAQSEDQEHQSREAHASALPSRRKTTSERWASRGNPKRRHTRTSSGGAIPGR